MGDGGEREREREREEEREGEGRTIVTPESAMVEDAKEAGAGAGGSGVEG